MFTLSVQWWEIVARTVAVYVLVFVLLRISGKRELGQMTPFELVVILVIANAVQNAMNGGDNSLLGGIIAATTLVITNIIVQRFAHRVPFLERVFSSEPTVLIDNGRIVDRNREREDVSLEELEMAAREKGIDDLKEVKRAVLEVNGDISIIPKDGGGANRRRRLRQFRRQ
ncbi:MAG TPA: YetF domain-containing protein [Candidatus Dormibacteraeota bacterium]|nr:YetF domain-containing protein [Candidatus Dormibacteraeota bacterium]